MSRVAAYCLFAVIFISLNESSYGQHDDMASLYNDGLSSMKKGEWQSAINSFANIVSAKCDAMTYYLLGVSWVHLYDYLRAIDSEDNALECKPELAPQYYGEAIKVINLSIVELASKKKEIMFGLSVKNRAQKGHDLEKLRAIKQEWQKMFDRTERHVPGLRDFYDKMGRFAGECGYSPSNPEQVNNCIESILGNETNKNIVSDDISSILVPSPE